MARLNECLSDMSVARIKYKILNSSITHLTPHGLTDLKAAFHSCALPYNVHSIAKSTEYDLFK